MLEGLFVYISLSVFKYVYQCFNNFNTFSITLIPFWKSLYSHVLHPSACKKVKLDFPASDTVLFYDTVLKLRDVWTNHFSLALCIFYRNPVSG